MGQDKMGCSLVEKDTVEQDRTERYEARLEDVAFSYGGKQVLQNLSLMVRPGEHIGIVGDSGCGKSTLLKLLAGLYEPDSGSVEVMGKQTPGDIRKQVALVMQQNALFPPVHPGQYHLRPPGAGGGAVGGLPRGQPCGLDQGPAPGAGHPCRPAGRPGVRSGQGHRPVRAGGSGEAYGGPDGDTCDPPSGGFG